MKFWLLMSTIVLVWALWLSWSRRSAHQSLLMRFKLSFPTLIQRDKDGLTGILSNKRSSSLISDSLMMFFPEKLMRWQWSSKIEDKGQKYYSTKSIPTTVVSSILDNSVVSFCISLQLSQKMKSLNFLLFSTQIKMVWSLNQSLLI